MLSPLYDEPRFNMTCKHKEFEAHCGVNRIEDSEVWYVDVRIRCTHCGMVGRFLGMDPGAGGGVPRCSLFADEARLPCVIDLPAEVWDDHNNLSEAAQEKISQAMNRVLDAGPSFTVRRGNTR